MISHTIFLKIEFVLLHHCYLVQAASRNCGTPKIWPKFGQTIPNAGKYRIVSGYEPTQHSFPWIVSIGRSGEHFCGGSIIRCPKGEQAKVVVSAAHCFYGYGNDIVKV
uniref:Peptidase S1 domain-containing protein n=1 Tax=Romanomermis culicivorax TaxID=13658 RepID=A0A915IZ34_ROMCU